MSKLIGLYGGPVAHDAGAVYIKDGQIQSIVQEERPRRVKVADDPDASPLLSLSRIQKEFNLDLNEIDYFCTATPMGITSEYWMQYGIDKEKISITNHHDAHCYGAYYTSGFNDPRSAFSSQVDYSGDPSYGPYPVDGRQYKMPSGHELGIPDTNRLGQGQESEDHNSLIDRRYNRQTDIPIATQPYLSTVSDEAIQETRTTFEEPHPKNILEDADPYPSAQYPFNHVFETESGHIVEYDDTDGKTRLHEYHKFGTFREIDEDGNRHERIVKDNYEFVRGDEYRHIFKDV